MPPVSTFAGPRPRSHATSLIRRSATPWVLVLIGALLLHSSTGSAAPPEPAGGGAATAGKPVEPSTDEAASSASDGGDWDFANPFSRIYDDGPGLFRIGLHVGSALRTGIGPSLTIVPWEYLRLTASYGYRSDHNIAGMLSIPIVPRALLTPYVAGGYALAIASLPQGIRLYSHQLVLGLGLEARLYDRYVLGAEVTGNGIASQQLKDKATTHELAPGERLTIQGGFHVGVHLP